MTHSNFAQGVVSATALGAADVNFTAVSYPHGPRRISNPGAAAAWVTSIPDRSQPVVLGMEFVRYDQ